MDEQKRRWLFPPVFLSVVLFVCACPIGVTDDDDIGDDDDTGANDDDVGDDDDGGFDYTAVTLRGSLLVIPPQGGDDDDDSAADDDDDDSAGGGVTARDTSDVEGTFLLDYWRDFDAQLLECQQRLSWGGTVDFASGLVAECSGCTGVLTLDGASILDESSRPLDPSACDPADLAAVGRDLGQLLTQTGPGPAGGGLLELGLMDLQTALDLGVQPAVSGNLDLETQAAQVAATGNLLTHIGFVSSAGGTLFDEIDFETAAGASGTGEPWSVFWFLFRPESQGTSSETDLSGAYQLGSFWILQ